ncbi:MAG TPA: hypothetical protein PK095_08030, partial [Myxococcota bacterium]|nr:hypothetical protein [Myxococcota bacterium]
DFSEAPPELVRFVDGAIAWREPAPEGAALTLVAHDDGGYSLAGRFEGAFGELDSAGLEDGWVTRYDSAGGPVWTARLGGRDEDAVLALANDGDDLFVTGYVSLDARWEVGDQGRDIPDELPDINHLDMVLLRVAPDGTPRWHTRARGEGNNEGRSVALGLDGSIHVGGLGAAPVRFGAGTDAPGFAIDSRLFFYAGWVASFDATSGSARTAWATSDTAPVITAMWVVGHPDSTTTWVGNALGIGAYGVDPERRTTIGQEVNATIFMVHTPDPRCR